MLIRGLNVVVLNEVTGVVMSSRWFDTYESDADSGFLIEYLKGLRDGRIVCFAIKVIEPGAASSIFERVDTSQRGFPSTIPLRCSAITLAVNFIATKIII